MKVLLHYSKNGPVCWVASDDNLDAAFTELFQRLDEDGHYSSAAIPALFYPNFQAARKGDIRQIKAILSMRNGREHETWRVVHARPVGI